MDKKNHQNLQFPLGCELLCNTSTSGPIPFTIPNGSFIALCTFTQLCNEVSIGYNEMPHIHPLNWLFPWDNRHPHTLALSLDPPDPPQQTESRSNQPFFHSKPDRQTNRPMEELTDGIGNKTCTSTCLRSIDYSNATNNTYVTLVTDPSLRCIVYGQVQWKAATLDWDCS